MLKSAKKKKSQQAPPPKDSLVSLQPYSFSLINRYAFQHILILQEEHEQLLVGLIKEVLRRYPQLYVLKNQLHYCVIMHNLTGETIY